jgi:aldehyde:ferredoxin oxidoreductase
MGYGRRVHDAIPYRAMGPVTVDKYESRQERYDTQLMKKYEINIEGKDIAEKVALLRKFREEEYEKLIDAVYERRGWTREGIPTMATVERLGIDLPEVVAVLKANGIT